MAEETDTPTTEAQAKQIWAKALDTVKQVIVDPAGFFRAMPKSGGFGEPLIFMVIMGLAAGVVGAVFGLLRLGYGPRGIGALGVIVAYPIGAVIGGFVGGLILFVIWKLMGSKESYETAYRCGAYMSAIMPFTLVLGAIPYVGPLVQAAWGLWLVVNASVEVHKIKAQTAWIVFGILTALMALGGISSQRTARRLERELQQYGIKSGKEMTPEEAGRATAAFVKAFQEQAAKDAAKEESEPATESEQ